MLSLSKFSSSEFGLSEIRLTRSLQTLVLVSGFSLSERRLSEVCLSKFSLSEACRPSCLSVRERALVYVCMCVCVYVAWWICEYI